MHFVPVLGLVAGLLPTGPLPDGHTLTAGAVAPIESLSAPGGPGTWPSSPFSPPWPGLVSVGSPYRADRCPSHRRYNSTSLRWPGTRT